jgi:hypothetical protein
VSKGRGGTREKKEKILMVGIFVHYRVVCFERELHFNGLQSVVLLANYILLNRLNTTSVDVSTLTPFPVL